jgi:predicted nucleic-acid-binding protein
VIGLDANILVRYFAQDDAMQSARAIELLERRISEDNPGFVSMIAMVEMARVLERSCGLADDELAAIIERLLQASVLVIENEVEVFTAMTALKEGRGGFADVLLGELGRRAGCATTLTFDQRASRLPSFSLA